MKIRIKGKLELNNRSFYTERERASIAHIGEGFVFVEYLTDDIYLEDVFVLEDQTEIVLKEIKLQFPTKEPLDSMGHGWPCLCRFENLDLNKIPAARYWHNDAPVILANKKSIT